jgi:hypothetical protein
MLPPDLNKIESAPEEMLALAECSSLRSSRVHYATRGPNNPCPAPVHRRLRLFLREASHQSTCALILYLWNPLWSYEFGCGHKRAYLIKGCSRIVYYFCLIELNIHIIWL